MLNIGLTKPIVPLVLAYKSKLIILSIYYTNLLTCENDKRCHIRRMFIMSAQINIINKNI